MKIDSTLPALPEWCQNVPLGAAKYVAECGGTTPVGAAEARDFNSGSPAPQAAAADTAAAKAAGAAADPKASANPTSADATGSEILP